MENNANKPKLTMIELFSGLGAQKRGIDDTNLFDLSVLNTSDIDKEAVVEYATIHHGLTNEMIKEYSNYPSKEEMAQSLTDRKIGLDFKTGKVYDWSKLAKKKSGFKLEKYWLAAELGHNMGDISSIKELPYSDVLTYSFPCTDISIAGKQEGLSKDSGTRSGLLWEVERLLTVAQENNTLPKYLYLENVKNLVGKQFKPEFDKWCKRLEELNYVNYWKVLNAKECGVPQNRERCMMISISKDIDTGKFTFPLPFDTGVRLKNILEKDVEEKYYISTERANNLIKQLIDKGQLNGKRECCDSTINDPNIRDISNCIIARYDAGISNQKSTGLAVVEPRFKEEWKPIIGYEGLYEISNYGNVHSIDRIVVNSDRRIKDDNKKQKTLKGCELNLLESKVGYYVVNLSKNGERKIHYVHRLVAQHFVKEIDGKEYVNHIDGNKHNNLYTNLEWVTNEENMYHAWETGLCHSSPLTGGAKAVAKIDKDTGEILDIYISAAEASRKNDYKSASGISSVLTGEKITSHGFKWEYVDELIKQGKLTEENKQKEMSAMLVKNMGTEYVKPLDESITLKARDWKGWDNYGSTAVLEESKATRIGGLWDGETKHQAGSVWDKDGLAPTLDTMAGGLRQPCILENDNTIWEDINSQYKISNKGTVADIINRCKVEVIDGKVELEIKGKKGKIPVEKLMNKYFSISDNALADTSKPICVGNTTPSGKSQCNAVYSTDGVSQTLCAGTHGYATGNILEESETNQNNTEVVGIKQATKKGYIECELPGVADFSFPNSTKRRGRVQDGGQTCPTLTAAEGGIRYIESIYRIRKLTVRECFALMGFKFLDWDKCQAIGISNSAGYKAAGNSIVTNCISLLFEHLYKAQYDDSYVCTDEGINANFQKPQVD